MGRIRPLRSGASWNLPAPMFIGGMVVLLKVALPASLFILSGMVGRDLPPLLAGFALLTLTPLCGAFGGMIYHLAQGQRPAAGARHYLASILGVFGYLGGVFALFTIAEQRWPSRVQGAAVTAMLYEPAGQIIYLVIGITFGFVIGYFTREA